MKSNILFENEFFQKKEKTIVVEATENDKQNRRKHTCVHMHVRARVRTHTAAHQTTSGW